MKGRRRLTAGDNYNSSDKVIDLASTQKEAHDESKFMCVVNAEKT